MCGITASSFFFVELICEGRAGSRPASAASRERSAGRARAGGGAAAAAAAPSAASRRAPAKSEAALAARRVAQLDVDVVRRAGRGLEGEELHGLRGAARLLSLFGSRL